MTNGGGRNTFGGGSQIPQDILYAEGLAETSQINDHHTELKQMLLNPQ